MDHSPTAELDRRTVHLLRSHTERCLQDLWDVRDLFVDTDEDYPFRNGTAAGWVRVLAGALPAARVFAHAAHGVRPSARLLREVNDLNLRARAAKVCLERDVVVVSLDLHATAVDRPALADAIVHVGSVAADIGPLLATVFGGSTPYPPAETTDTDTDSTTGTDTGTDTEDVA